MKFLSWKINEQFNLNDKTKWATEDGKTYKLLNPDLKLDKQYATAEIVVEKGTKAIKEGEKLWIAGLANANIVDRMQERLDPRGLIVNDYMKNRMLLAHHSYYHPIGQVEELDIQENGVHFKAWIGDPARAELTDTQKEIRSLVAQGILRTVSVGFIPRKVRAPLYNDDGSMAEAPVIESWELLELSVVAVPCNQDSVFEIRSMDDNKGEQMKVTKGKKTIDETEAGEATDTKEDVLGQEIVTLLRSMAEMMKRQAEVTDLILTKLEAEDAGESSEEGGETPPPEQEGEKSGESVEAQAPQEENTGAKEESAVNAKIEEIEKTLLAFNAKFDKITETVKILAERILKK